MDSSTHQRPVIAARRSSLPAVAAVSLVTVPVMTLALPVAFLFAYGFQETTVTTHLTFLMLVGFITLVQTAVAGPALARPFGLSVPRSSAGTLLVTLAWLTATGSVYSLVNVLPALDPSVTSGMSDVACIGTGLALGVVTVLVGRAGAVLLRPAGHGSAPSA